MKSKAERLEAFKKIDLYPVTDSTQSLGRTNYEVLDGLIAGGAKIVQLREKQLSKKELLSMAQKFRERTQKAGMLLFINDHLDIALAVGADGVHLGQDDLPLEYARRLAPEILIGISTHSLSQALAAQAVGADYVNIGPIFPTGTKQTPMAPLGPEAIARIKPHFTIPFTVMGGINRDNIEQVLKAGASKVAVVTAVTKAPDIPRAIEDLREMIRSYALKD
jgi:thiamine-phosphate pyrophosphorylase